MNSSRKIKASFVKRLVNAVNIKSWLRPDFTPRAALQALSIMPVRFSRLSVQQQWTRLASIVGSATMTAKQVGDLQKSATDQLDSAYYNLNLLLDDVATVMLLPSHIVAMQEQKPRRKAVAAPFAHPAHAARYSAAA